MHKESADFVQFLGTTHGYRTAITETMANEKPYYTVTLNPKNRICNEGVDPYTTVSRCEVINYDEPEYAYCFRVPQGRLLLRRNDKIFITGNSGKTKVIIDNMAYLKKRGTIQAAIVLAPKGVYRNWSTQEIPKHMPESANAEVLVWKADGSAGYKSKLLNDIENWDGETFPILVFNIESLVSKAGIETMEVFMKKHKGLLMGVIDESTCIKNHKAKERKPHWRLDRGAGSNALLPGVLLLTALWTCIVSSPFSISKSLVAVVIMLFVMFLLILSE